MTESAAQSEHSRDRRVVVVDAGDLSLRVAEAVAATIDRAVRMAGKCSLVLSGGSTPRTLYSLLASRFREQIPWASVQVFWGDERYVPAEDSRSNYRMARELLLDRVPCPVTNIHPIPTHFSSVDDAARDYERTLRGDAMDDGPAFDLVLLGLGEDCHTASLFPGSLALFETTRWVVPALAPEDPKSRLTLTLPALARASAIYFIVAGAGKSEALQRVLAGTVDTLVCPAAGVRSEHGTVTWWVDREAARTSVGEDGNRGES